MTTDDLRAWQQRMGYTQQGAAEAIGVSLATYKRYISMQDGMVSKIVGLACAAIARGLREWSPKAN